MEKTRTRVIKKCRCGHMTSRDLKLQNKETHKINTRKLTIGSSITQFEPYTNWMIVGWERQGGKKPNYKA